MKMISYIFRGNIKTMPWSESNEEIAKREAVDGVYSIEENEEQEAMEPTAEERLTALEMAMLEMMGVERNG